MTTQQTTVQDGHSYIMHPVTLDMVRTCYTDYEFLRCQCEQEDELDRLDQERYLEIERNLT